MNSQIEALDELNNQEYKNFIVFHSGFQFWLSGERYLSVSERPLRNYEISAYEIRLMKVHNAVMNS